MAEAGVLTGFPNIEGADFDVYNKCVFRTINYFEVIKELEEKEIIYSPGDTYYILTLKLRRGILAKNDKNCAVAHKIEEEIAAFKASKHSVGSRYKCSLVGCPFSCTNHAKYLSHLEFVHYSSTSRLKCNFRHACSLDFPGVQQLKSHVNNCHKKRNSSVQIRQNQLVEELTTLRCMEASCGHATESSIKKLKKHLSSHTDRFELVQCIFCSYKTDRTGTLWSHMSRKHRFQTIDTLHPDVVRSSREFPATDIPEVDEVEDTVEPSLDFDEDEPDDEVGEIEDDQEEVFLKALAITVIYSLF